MSDFIASAAAFNAAPKAIFAEINVGNAVLTLDGPQTVLAIDHERVDREIWVLLYATGNVVLRGRPAHSLARG